MTADIVQELNDEARSCINLADGAQNAIVNERENRLAMQFSRAAAEIVRLRGEVADLAARRAEDLAIIDGIRDAIGGGPYDTIAARIRKLIPAPAMPNGVEAADVHLAAEMLTWGREEGLTVKQEAEVAAHAEKLFRLLRAADNRDAAWVICRVCDGGPGNAGSCLCGERKWDTPAAVPAGEAVAVCGTCNGVGMIGGHRGQTPDSFEQWAEDCPDCTPQPADGEAVAEWQVWHDQDGWGATHPDNVAEYRARGVPVRPLYAHPPAPVQAAPQEGEVLPRELVQWMRARDILPDEPFTDADLIAALNNHEVELLAAHPSACELGDAFHRLAASARIMHDDRQQELVCIPPKNWREMWDALQHRGDS